MDWRTAAICCNTRCRIVRSLLDVQAAAAIATCYHAANTPPDCVRDRQNDACLQSYTYSHSVTVTTVYLWSKLFNGVCTKICQGGGSANSGADSAYDEASRPAVSIARPTASLPLCPRNYWAWPNVNCANLCIEPFKSCYTNFEWKF